MGQGVLFFASKDHPGRGCPRFVPPAPTHPQPPHPLPTSCFSQSQYIVKSCVHEVKVGGLNDLFYFDPEEMVMVGSPRYRRPEEPHRKMIWTHGLPRSNHKTAAKASKPREKRRPHLGLLGDGSVVGNEPVAHRPEPSISQKNLGLRSTRCHGGPIVLVCQTAIKYTRVVRILAASSAWKASLVRLVKQLLYTLNVI